MLVKRELMDIDTAQGVLNWPHSGFHTHDGVRAARRVGSGDSALAEFLTRLPIL